MEREEAISKIQKLLALSASPNKNEAMVAMKKARHLMLEYHVTEEESKGEQKAEVVWREVPITFDLMSSVSAVIARNNKCDCYTSIRSNNGKRKTRIMHIVGYSFDVEAVCTMIKFCEESILDGVRKLRKEVRESDYYADVKGLKGDYAYGFLKGLQQAFDEQNAKQEYHLLVITPKEVKDEMDKQDLKTVHRSHSISTSGYFNRGFSSGYDCGTTKKIAGGC